MLTLSVYSLDRRLGSPWYARSIEHVNLFGVEKFTPAVARKALALTGFLSGAVFHDDEIVDGRKATVEYRVYNGGRTRRRVHFYNVWTDETVLPF